MKECRTCYHWSAAKGTQGDCNIAISPRGEVPEDAEAWAWAEEPVTVWLVTKPTFCCSRWCSMAAGRAEAKRESAE